MKRVRRRRRRRRVGQAEKCTAIVPCTQIHMNGNDALTENGAKLEINVYVSDPNFS